MSDRDRLEKFLAEVKKVTKCPEDGRFALEHLEQLMSERESLLAGIEESQTKNVQLVLRNNALLKLLARIEQHLKDCGYEPLDGYHIEDRKDLSLLIRAALSQQGR